ncbi:MAG: VWA domain-containing protein, partial [Fimbriimonadaceae bacterium]|nr:VWA domain-containing protein [Fimbriimonadaceae bacterium]
MMRYICRLLALLVILILLPPAGTQAQATQEAPCRDIVLIIDRSGSMRDNDPSSLSIAAVKLFVDLLDVCDRVGFVVMSDAAHTRPWNPRMTRIKEKNDILNLKKEIQKLASEPLGEETHMGTALEYAYTLLETTVADARGPNQEQFVLLLTDGLPTGDKQRERIHDVIARFQERGYRKIFAVALGAGADVSYLQQAITQPTDGKTFTATPEELINRYLDIYTLLGDDRFVDRIVIPSNTLTPLATVHPDQLLSQISVVVPGVERLPDKTEVNIRIRQLYAPEGHNIAEPEYERTVHRGAEEEYTLYIVPKEAQVG